MTSAVDRVKKSCLYALGCLLLPVLLVLAAGSLAWTLVWGVVLRAWFWRTHASRGRRVLFVYSESPNWQAYIEESILPRIRDRAVVLNWSERRLWRSTCPREARFFRRFAGDRDFNPIALVYVPGGRIQRIRFHRAFLDFKHGKDSALRAAEAELFSLLETAG